MNIHILIFRFYISLSSILSLICYLSYLFYHYIIPFAKYNRIQQNLYNTFYFSIHTYIYITLYCAYHIFKLLYKCNNRFKLLLKISYSKSIKNPNKHKKKSPFQTINYHQVNWQVYCLYQQNNIILHYQIYSANWIRYQEI